MNSNDQSMKAAEYVLGTLEENDRHDFEVEMGQNPSLRELVETWEGNFAPLLTSMPEATPSPDTWSQIERRIAACETASDSIRTVLKNDAVWTTFLPGVTKKQLHIDPKGKTQCYLLRFAPGASLPPHSHTVTEECIVLEGEVSVAGQALSAGDFQMLPAGSRHLEMSSKDGAVVYVRGEIDGPVWNLSRFARNIGAMISRSAE